MSVTKIFIDTSFIIALINERDQYHAFAVSAVVQYDSQILVITDAILLEIGNALARGYKSEASQIIEEFLTAENVEIVHLSSELLNRAFILYKTYQDKEWGLVDCVSFVVMKDAHIHAALTFDRHFVQAGFQTLPVQTRMI